MKKKHLALAALFSTAAICVGVGACVLNGNATVVNAADPVTTWTDESTGITYTFDYDISTGYYTDIGDLTAPLDISSETGHKYANIPQSGVADISRDEAKDGSFVMNNTTGFVTYTNGIAFQMKTEDEWVRPAGNRSTTSYEESKWARVDVFYGDSKIFLARYGNTNTLRVEFWHHNGTEYITGLDGSTNVIATVPNFFVNGKMSDWAEIKISKIQCTKISNSSTATGYWMNFSIKAPGANEATPIINQYFNHEGTYGWNNCDAVVIKNCTTLEAANADYDIDANTDGVQRYENPLYLRRADGNYIDEATYYEDEVSYDASYWAKQYGQLDNAEVIKLVNGTRTVTSAGNTGAFATKNPTAYTIAGASGDASKVVLASNGVSAKVAPADGTALTEKWDMLGGFISNIAYYFTYSRNRLLLNIDQRIAYDGNKYAWADSGAGSAGTVRSSYILTNDFDASVAHTYEITRRLVKEDTTTGKEAGYLLTFYIDKGTDDEIVLKLNSGFAADSRWNGMTFVANFGKDVIVGDAYSVTEAETYTDMGEVNDNFAYGCEFTSSSRWGEPGAYKAKNGNIAKSDGFEARFKGVAASTLLSAPVETAYGFMRAEVGASSVLFNLSASKTIAFDTFNTASGHLPTGTYSTSIVYEHGEEYVVRMTRSAVDYQGTAAGMGAIVRMYIAKVDATTGAPAEGWDATPAAQWFDYSYFRNQSTPGAGDEALCLYATPINNKTNNDMCKHTVQLSSNKYVGVKTVVDGTTTLNKVERGGDFTFPTVENIVAWKSDSAVVAEGALTGVTQSATYTAYTLAVKDSAYASLRFRPIDSSAALTVDNIQVSIKFTAEVNRADAESVKEALGATDMEIGYVITKHGATDAEDVKSNEIPVESFAGNTFSVLQSGITEADYGTQFSMQSYVKFTLEDDSTVYVWGEVNEGGYTKNNTTVAHIVNGAWATATGAQSEEYCYEVETGVYSCYDTTLYTVLKNYYNLIDA